MPFLPNILAAHLVEHVDEHGESAVKPDLTDLNTNINIKKNKI